MSQKVIIGSIAAIIVVVGAYMFINRPALAGPYGGEVVKLDDGTSYVEMLANKESGELMAHVWGNDLKTRHPILNEPITVGSGNNSVQLMPHPMADDPAGTCSRFYGQADWLHGGGIRQGWLHMNGRTEQRQEFAWNRSWQGGQSHGNMWQEIEGHRMGPGKRMGPAGGHGN